MERFQGPLDLLLQLIEEEDLDITEVSLAQVAQQYLQYLDTQTEIPSDELADFLLVAAKLVFLKSKTVLPELTDDEEDGEAEITQQLKVYRAFVKASYAIQQLVHLEQYEYVREYRLREMRVFFSPPIGITPDVLKNVFISILASITPLVRLEERAIQAEISLHDQMEILRAMLQSSGTMIFQPLMMKQHLSRAEIVTRFLALLELLKVQEVQVQQEDLFADIVIFSERV